MTAEQQDSCLRSRVSNGSKEGEKYVSNISPILPYFIFSNGLEFHWSHKTLISCHSKIHEGQYLSETSHGDLAPEAKMSFVITSRIVIVKCSSIVLSNIQLQHF